MAWGGGLSSAVVQEHFLGDITSQFIQHYHIGSSKSEKDMVI